MRRALGYGRINFSAVSYGSRVAFTYASRYPRRVRSLSVLGAAPWSFKVPLTFAPTAQHTLDVVLAACVADTSCTRAHPGVRAGTVALFARLWERASSCQARSGQYLRRRAPDARGRRRGTAVHDVLSRRSAAGANILLAPRPGTSSRSDRLASPYDRIWGAKASVCRSGAPRTCPSFRWNADKRLRGERFLATTVSASNWRPAPNGPGDRSRRRQGVS